MVKKSRLYEAMLFADGGITLIAETDEDKHEILCILAEEHDASMLMVQKSLKPNETVLDVDGDIVHILSVETLDRFGIEIPDGFLIESCLSNYCEGDEIWRTRVPRKSKSGSSGIIKPPRI